MAKAIALTGFSALSLFAAAPAQAVILDFQSLEVVGMSTPGVNSPYTENGFIISNPRISYFGTLDRRYQGSTALFAASTFTPTISLAQVGNGSFTLTSIDLTDLNGDGIDETYKNVTVSFTGLRTDNSTITQAFTTDALRGFQTFNFSNFTNLVSVDWNQDAPFHQFDNINVTPTNATEIPEPFTMLGTITAAGFAAAFKQKLAKTQKDNKDIV